MTAFLENLSWRLIVVVALILVAGFMMYRWNKMRGNKYDVLDLITTEEGRADLWKHLIVFFAALSAWVIIQKMVTNPEGDITGLLTIVLGVFVSKEILGAFADAMKNRPPAVPASAPEVRIIAAAAEAPTAAPAAPVADSDVRAAGRGIEKLAPKIGPEDVGKNVALVSTKRKKRPPTNAKPQRNR